MFDLWDVRYWKKFENDQFTAGVTTTWADAGTNARIANGVAELKNDNDSAWYKVRCRNNEDGYPVLFAAS